MIVRSYAIDSKALDLSAVRKELLSHLKGEGDGKSHTWGYFPELKTDTAQYQRSTKLLENLHERLFPELDVDPAFVRIATAEPKSDFGGLHIDVSPGIGHQKHHVEGGILRILINIGDYPRKLLYSPLPLEELRKKYEIDIPEKSYSIINLPPEVPTKVLEIPPLEEGYVHVLCFRSDKVVHAGLTTEAGHFLASFGKVLPAADITRFFEQ